MTRRAVLVGSVGVGIAAGRATAQENATPVASASPVAVSAEPLWTVSLDGLDAPETPTVVNRAPDGRLWVADAAGNRYSIYGGADGSFVETWAPEAVELDLPDDGAPTGDVAFAQDGAFYIAGNASQSVLQFAPDRTFVRAWDARGLGDGEFLAANHVAVAPDGDVYVADFQRGDIQRFTSDGRFVAKLGVPAETGGGLEWMSWAGITVGADGTIYAVDFGELIVAALAPDGTLLRTVGGPGRGPEQIAQAFDCAVDPAGNLHVADAGDGRIEVYGPDGTHRGAWDGSGTTDGSLVTPWSLVIDPEGTAFVLDTDSRLLRAFRLLPPPATS